MKIKHLVNSLLMGTLMIVPYVQAANTTTEKGKNQMNVEQTEKSNEAVKRHEKEQYSLLKTVNQGVLDGYKKVLGAAKLLTKDGKEQEVIIPIPINTHSNNAHLREHKL